MEPLISNLLQIARNTKKAPRSVILASAFLILLVITVSYYLNTPGRLLDEGLRYRKVKNWQDAVSSFKKALAFNMKSPRTLSLLGEEYFCAGDLTRGKYYLSKAVTFNNADGRAFYYMGALYACQGDNGNTSRMINECESKTSGQERDYCSLLKVLASVMFPSYQNFTILPDDERKLTDSILKSGNSLFFKVHLGLLALYRERFDEGRKIFEELSSSYPDDSSITAYHCIALSLCGRRDEALIKLRSAVVKDERNPVAEQYLGALYLENDQPDESLKALQTARAISPGSPGPYYYLGLLHIKKGSFNEARGFLEESLQKQPNDGMAHQKLGEVYEKLGMKKKAQEEFEKKITQAGPLYIFAPPY